MGVFPLGGPAPAWPCTGTAGLKAGLAPAPVNGKSSHTFSYIFASPAPARRQQKVEKRPFS